MLEKCGNKEIEALVHSTGKFVDEVHINELPDGSLIHMRSRNGTIYIIETHPVHESPGYLIRTACVALRSSPHYIHVQEVHLKNAMIKKGHPVTMLVDGKVYIQTIVDAIQLLSS